MNGTESELRLILTNHAQQRMNARRLSADEIDQVQTYGSEYRTRNAIYFVVGKKDVAKFGAQRDLSPLEGVHVVCSKDGTVMTAYRNRGFKPRAYRKGTGRRRRRHR